MERKAGTHAVVIGAGIGGLAAAGALAGHVERVTVFERDGLPSGPEPRLGAPQGRHVHALLAGGQRALEEVFPGLRDDLITDGAVQTGANAETRFEAPGYDPFPQRDFGWTTLCMSRPLLEFAVRRKVIAAGVDIVERRRVRRLETTPDGSAIVAVHV
jgi:2-polyprenyl-6-methoxyphenol hydroxylase-like FAD-dependent oxidoreductase